MVTGTLGLAAPKTRAAMKAAAQMVKAGGGKVSRGALRVKQQRKAAALLAEACSGDQEMVNILQVVEHPLSLGAVPSTSKQACSVAA